MEKQLIFISHITEEKELALNLKQLIEDKFLGMVEVFVSSDENSIKLGQEWLENITKSLRTCCIELILCSPISISKPWINFEAGAGWVRENCTVIPICHSNMRPENLPLPLNLLQGMMLNNQIKVQELIKDIARQMGCKTPSLDCNEFMSKVQIFEEKYTYWNVINENVEKFFKALSKYGFINQGNSYFTIQNTINNYKSLLQIISQNGESMDIKMYISNYDYKIFEILSELNILKSVTLGMGKSNGGNYTQFKIVKLSKFDDIITNPKFIYCITEEANAR